jgi:hypothetical protein
VGSPGTAPIFARSESERTQQKPASRAGCDGRAPTVSTVTVVRNCRRIRKRVRCSLFSAPPSFRARIQARQSHYPDDGDNERKKGDGGAETHGAILRFKTSTGPSANRLPHCRTKRALPDYAESDVRLQTAPRAPARFRNMEIRWRRS